MVKINGVELNEEKIIGMSLNEYFQYANYNASGVVVEKNLEIIHKEDFDSVFIEDGDFIEVLMFMGGG